MSGSQNDPHQILFEITAIGSSVKVVAIDSATGIEATIIGPASAGQAMLQQQAVRKLQYVMTQKAGKE